MEDRALRRGNASLAVLHAAQAAVILALSTDFSLPVTGAFMEGQPGSGLPKQDLLFNLRIGPLVAAFLLLAALDHALVALPPCRARYERCLAEGVNPFRWLEYSLSASLMVVLIAMLTGIADYVALLALFAVNAAMIFLGWLMELLNPPDRARTRWLPFVLGCVVGAVAWIAIAVQIGLSAGRGHAPPSFVYAIFVSLFVLFNSFAVNQALQYKRVGRWRDYRYGERWYLWLSLVAKSLLAWQVFANVLVL
ncbi:MAG TPA: heliorhodopsin HeR [Gaiellaceae bacterium]|nr:heliorhodopsin HeR [Gaiellaceae bacterium]